MNTTGAKKFVLNEEQSQVFSYITEKIQNKENSLQLTLFISGTSGTGKSYLLQALNEELSVTKFCRVVSYKRKSAIAIGGKTIYSFFGFDYNLISHEYFTKSLSSLEVLLIDEVCRVSATYLNAIDRALKSAKNNERPFGGVHIIAFGDLFLLPPYHHDIFEPDTINIFGRCEYIFQSSLWSMFSLFELQQNMRYTDVEFSKNLNKIRVGDKTALDYFNQFVCKDEMIFDDDKQKPLVISSTRNYVDDYNKQCLKKYLVENENVSSHTCEARCESTIINNDDSAFFYSPSQTMPIPKKITLTQGTRVLVTINDEDNDISNGDTGEIISIEEKKDESDGSEVESVLIKLDSRPNEPIRMKRRMINLQKAGDLDSLEKVEGFPLIYTWALTIHMIHGSIVDRVLLAPDGIFAAGQLYVALSRARTHEGLFLLTRLFEKHLIANYEVLECYRSMNKLEIICDEPSPKKQKMMCE